MYMIYMYISLTDAEFDVNYIEEVLCLFSHIYYEHYTFPENAYNPK
jgi:hypothetical protein